jgi:hypothetical protein
MMGEVKSPPFLSAMATIFKDTIKSHISESLKQLETSTDMEIFTKMKEILNRTFGEAHNQIIKPSLETIERYVQTKNDIMKGEILRLDHNNVVRWLKDNHLLDYTLCIWFPETKIKNSKGAEQIIRDLYVKVPIKPNGKFAAAMSGITATYTNAQYRVGYMHSHLRRFGSYGPEENYFCLGVGQIAMVLAVLANKYDEVNFQLFCFHLKNYVAWESLEGTPFIQMAEVIAREGTPLDRRVLPTTASSIATNLINTLFKGMETEEILKLIKFSVSKAGVEVFPTEELELLLANMMTEKTHPLRVETFYPQDTVVAYKTNRGEYYNISSSNERSPTLPTRPAIYFKNQEVKFKMADKDQQTKKTLYANPVITRSFCEQLSRKFTTTTLALERGNWFKDTGDDLHKTTDANSVAL